MHCWAAILHDKQVLPLFSSKDIIDIYTYIYLHKYIYLVFNLGLFLFKWNTYASICFVVWLGSFWVFFHGLFFFFLREGAICLGFCFVLGKAIKHSHILSTHAEDEVVSLNTASGTHCFHLRGAHGHHQLCPGHSSSSGATMWEQNQTFSLQKSPTTSLRALQEPQLS